jgi:hypothetical protein
MYASTSILVITSEWLSQCHGTQHGMQGSDVLLSTVFLLKWVCAISQEALKYV